MSLSTTLYAASSDQWEACCIPGSSLDQGVHYNFDKIGGVTNANEWLRGLLWFDLSTIPYEATFTVADLSLYMDADSATVSHSFYFYRVTSEWDSFYVDNTQRLGGPTNWAAAGGDYTDLCDDFNLAPGDAPRWCKWEFGATGLGAVRTMRQGNNYGFLLKSSSEDELNMYWFRNPGEANPPKLELTYTLPSVAQMSTVFF